MARDCHAGRLATMAPGVWSELDTLEKDDYGPDDDGDDDDGEDED